MNITLPSASPRLRVLPPLSIYVHIPWCVRKCPYCDFNSHELHGEHPEQAYIDALTADLESALPLIWGRKVYTVFFGGGTPSVFSAAGIAQILDVIRARVPLSPEAEITLEANPGTVEAEKFAGFKNAGINRLSIGIQSFNPKHLKTLGRIHDDTQARAAIEMAQAHFDNFNLDLMYGLPNQTIEEARADIATALSFQPAHLSAYHLTIEPETYFYKHPPQVPDDDTTAAMQEAIEETLANAGFRHYETSAFAQPGKQSRHNMNYWTFGDYLGIGAGAHSKISFPDRIVRQARYKSPKLYMEKTGLPASSPHAGIGGAIQTQHEIATEDLPFEFMLNALRLNAGFPIVLFEERAGLPLNAMLKPLALAEEKGLLMRDHQRITPTPLGKRFLNDLLQLFLAEDNVPNTVSKL